MKSFSTALTITILLLVSHVQTLKMGSIPVSTIEKKTINHSFVETSADLNQFMNEWIRIKSIKSGKCIKMPPSSNTAIPNSKLVLEDCQNTDEFLWMITKNSDGTYIIFSRTGNYVFDNYNSKSDNGNPIIAWPLAINNDQKWIASIYNEKYFRLISKENNKCLTVENGNSSSGESVQIWDCQINNENQGFDLLLRDKKCDSRDPNDPFDRRETIPDSRFIGSIIQIISKRTGKCLRVINKGRITQEDCDSTFEFSWKLIQSGYGRFIIKSYINDFVFENDRGQTYNGNSIMSNINRGGTTQMWIIEWFNQVSRTYFFKSVQSDKCIDVPNGNPDNGVGMQLWDCDKNSSSQEFIFKIITPITINIYMKPYIVINSIVTIRNPVVGKCLKFNEPNSRLIQDDCQETPEFAWKIIYYPNDNTYSIVSLLGDFAFDNENGFSHNGNSIRSWESNTESYQRWYISFWDSTSVIFQESKVGKCIDVPGGSTANGLGMQLWDCERRNTNQKFVFNFYKGRKNIHRILDYPDRFFQIIHQKTGKCLRYLSERGKLVLFDCYELGILGWKFTFDPIANYYTINSYFSRFAIENSGGKRNNGNQIITTIPNPISWFQKWVIEEIDINSNLFFIKGLISNVCIDVPGGQGINMIGLQAWECQKGNSNQIFTFKIIDPNPPNPLSPNPKVPTTPGVIYWVKIVNNMIGKCWKYLNVEQQLIQAECHDSDNQSWALTKNDDQTYSISSKISYYAVETERSSNNIATTIFSYTKSNTPAQNWYIVPYDDKRWRFINSQTYRTIFFPENGNFIDSSFSSVKHENQAFEFIAIGEKVKISGWIIESNNEKIEDCQTTFYKTKIEFRTGDNSYTAEIKKQDKYVYYEVTLPKGKYTRFITMNDYYSSPSFSIVDGQSDYTNNRNTLIVSKISKGFKIVLTWGNVPRTLSNSIIIPGIRELKDGRSDDGNIEVINDFNMNGYGPQQVTITETRYSTYTFVVNKISDDYNPLNRSDAKVIIYHDNIKLQEIEINPNIDISAKAWEVFRIENYNKIKVINQAY